MRELDLLSEYLVRLRGEKLQLAHQQALAPDCNLLHVQVTAHEAELCSRIRDAVKILANDPGKFIEEFLK